MTVKYKDGKQKKFSLDRLAISIDKAFKTSGLPHASYMSQIIAKASMDNIFKNRDCVIPEFISICTANILNELGYEDESTIYQSQPYYKK